jgi:hypothetical protein
MNNAVLHRAIDMAPPDFFNSTMFVCVSPSVTTGWVGREALLTPSMALIFRYERRNPGDRG